MAKDVIKEEEKVVETTPPNVEDNVVTTETTPPVEEKDPMMQMFDAQAARMQDAVTQAEASKNAATKALEDYNEAMANGQSGILTLLKKREPKYDAGKEERLRKAAIVQSFGDMAAAMARGAMAFRKKGANYVPKIDANSPLKSLEEINRMKELYRTNHKAWDDLLLNAEVANENAKVKAAEAMATAAQKRAEGDAKDAKDAIDKYLENWYNIMLEKEKAKNSAAEKQKDRENDIQAAIIRANSSSSNKKNSSGGGNDTDDDELWAQIAIAMWPEAKYATEAYDEEGALKGSNKRPLTTKEWADKAKLDKDARNIHELVSEGYELDEVVAAVKAEKNKKEPLKVPYKYEWWNE